MNIDKSFMKTNQETVQLLLETHSPVCEDVFILKGTIKTSSLRKILYKRHSTSDFLMNTDGFFTKTTQETVEFLMETNCQNVFEFKSTIETSRLRNALSMYHSMPGFLMNTD